ncbi:hypothetical protein V9T40_002264 [Parthenolecanium corni]|uniref:Uncharacterized protein n=1 Tax=Parthenolecanium corni TaxID=536013 RepID=A0AAN9TI72_9HEMI
MVAENKAARSPSKRYDPIIQHQLNFIERLVGVTNNERDDHRCPYHACRFVERHRSPKRGTHRENSQDFKDDPLKQGDMEEPEPDMGEAEEELAKAEEEEEEESKIRRHIHPCICDLTKSQRKRIKKHLDHRALMHRKYENRIAEIEEEFARLEEERLERERELEEQQELFGDEYELVGKKKKRKKRSARRASMVSLGVKQVINWRKGPKIQVKMTKASTLRKEYASYCGHRTIPETPWKHITYGEEPAVKVRVTKAFSLRLKSNQNKLKYLLDHEDKKPRFVLPYWV